MILGQRLIGWTGQQSPQAYDRGRVNPNQLRANGDVVDGLRNVINSHGN